MSIFKAIPLRAHRWFSHLGQHPPSDAQKIDRRQPASADFEQTFPATTYSRLAAAVRLVACFAAIHGLYFPVQQAPRVVPLLLLVVFAFYASWMYWRTVRDDTSQEPLSIYWVDTAWYLAFTSMTGGPSSHFSFFLSLPLLFVSLRWGFRPGIAMAVFASVALLIIGLANIGTGTPLLITDILWPPITLLVLGYLMATWANSILVLNRRLVALKEFNTLFNRRYHVEQMIDRVVRHLAKLYRVDKFAVVIVEAGASPKVFRANLPDAMYRVADDVATDIAHAMLGLDTKGTVIYCGNRGLVPAEIYCSDAHIGKQKNTLQAAITAGNRLNSSSFGSVHFKLRQDGMARLFVWSDTRSFGPADLPFFHQLSEQLSPRIENAQLLDGLASEVAEHERQKISRDVHDSAIQPYIGLKFGLEALARKVAPADPLAKDVARLVEMANTEITELRRFVKGLRSQGEPGDAALVPALHRQAERFGELYGINVEVASADELKVGDALANEAFHMVGEGLSNIRRHTTATTARISLSATAHKLTLKISNPCENTAQAKLFRPRSIAERAHVLGGTCQVETELGGETVVTIEIPLQT